MQEFLTNNTVTCNLMSLTGYRTLVLLSTLMESPKSIDEINDFFLNNRYIKEKFSNDTLRIYINSLRAIGCNITRADKSNKLKYNLISHPFSYNISKIHLKSLAKLYKYTFSQLKIQDIILLHKFFLKLSSIIENDAEKTTILGLSAIKNINLSLLEELISYCKKHKQIIIEYNSPKSGPKKIELIADKLSFRSEKLYLWGNSLTHKQYSFFSVEKIIRVIGVSINQQKEQTPQLTCVYELYNQKNYIPQPEETILEQDENKIVIKTSAQNEFNLIQKLLYLCNDCKILYPNEIKTKIITKLKEMENNYEKI